MARLRLPVAFSEAYTSSSSSSCAARERRVEVPDHREAFVGRRPGTSDTAAIAPALIIGFFGFLVVRSTLISLNASPDGSTPIFASTAASPIECERQRVGEGLGDRLDGEFDCSIAGFVDEAVGRRQRQAESVRVDPGQLGNVAGQRAVGHLGVLGADPVQVLLHQFGHASDSRIGTQRWAVGWG